MKSIPLALGLATVALIAWLAWPTHPSGSDLEVGAEESRPSGELEATLSDSEPSGATRTSLSENMVRPDPGTSSATSAGAQRVDPRWVRLSEIEREGRSAMALHAFASARVAEILEASGQWEVLEPQESIELGDRMDGNTQFILRSGPLGIRGYRATRSEFPVLFDLQDLANSFDPLSPRSPKASPELLQQVQALTEQAVEAAP